MEVVQAEGLRWWRNTYDGHIEYEPVKDVDIEVFIRRSDQGAWWVERVYSAPPRRTHPDYELRILENGPYWNLRDAMVQVKKLIDRNKKRGLTR